VGQRVTNNEERSREEVTVKLQDILDHELLNQLTVRQKIWGGFGIMLTIMAIVASIPLLTFTDVQSKVSYVTEDVQTALLASEDLAKHMNEAAGRLGFYLMSEEEHHLNEYKKTVAKIDEDITKLKSSDVVAESDEDKKLVEEIAADIEQFKEHGKQVTALVGNTAKNFTAMEYAAQNLNPVAQEMLQIMTEMVISESGESATSARKKLLIDINDFRYTWANLMASLRSYLILGSDDVMTSIKDFLQASETILNRVKAQQKLLTFEQLDGFERVVTLRQTFVKNIDGLIAINKSGKRRLDAYTVRTEIGPLMDRVTKNLNMLVEQQVASTTEISQSLSSRLDAVVAFILVLFMVGIVAATFVAWGIDALITLPLQNAAAAMRDISEGEGDLTQRLKVKGKDEIAQLAQAFNRFAEKIQGLVAQVTGFTATLASAATEMSAITETTSVGARRQHEETDQVASAITQMMSTVNETARNANEAATAAQHADIETNAGRDVVSKTVSSINSLAHEIDRVTTVIHRLGDDTANIGKVLDVIKGIAEQTNLLALNAAIEAARAGEQGRGFAVVADEVRTLASRTQQSTREIQEMIERLQSGSKEAVAAMDESRSMAQATVDQSSKAGESLDIIAGAVSTINTMNTQIATAMVEQNAVAENINKSIINISQVSDQTTEGSQQTAKASSDLSRLAVELQTLLSQFKT
jgi:methyl-accepting chemotaxis protein